MRILSVRLIVSLVLGITLISANTVPGVTLFGIAALILALGIAFYFERQAKRETGHGIL